MDKPILRALLLLSLLTSPRAVAAQALDEALDDVRPQAIRAHMAFLADDLLEGREAGTRGYQLAARYVASQFEALGLQPAGDKGGWTQTLDLRRSVQVEDGCSFTLSQGDRDVPLEYGVDYIMRGDANHTETDIDAPVVFVGYGVSAPDMDYDDFAGVDVKGKILVVLRGAPPSFPHNQRAYYSREKRNTAEKKGAIGVVSILNPEESAKRPWKRRVQNAHIARMRLLDADGKPIDSNPGLQAAASLSDAGMAKLFEGAPQSLDEVFAAAQTGKPNSFDLPWSAHMVRRSEHRNVRSRNVVARLPGSDPQLQQECVVYSAHLDHLGIGDASEGDRIYNGAFDNASGIAVMLEVARAFQSLPQPPRRSLLFLAVTAEEKGLLGSRHFAEFPTVPLQDIVANINLDMFLMLHPLRDIVAFGAEHTSLGKNVEVAARRLDIEVTPDPMPEEVIFVRSDQYSFVRKGIPAVFLTAGTKGEEAGGPTMQEWLRDRYHSQRDDMQQPMDLQSAVDFTRLNILLGADVANTTGRPRWNEGDFFGKLYGSQREWK
jgi:hypothetical protein